jgi:hypothetical protein
MHRRHSFTLPTLIALAIPAMLTNCVAEPGTDPGTGGAPGVGGTATAGTAGTGTAGTGTAGTGTAGTGTAGTGTAGTGTAGAGTGGTGTAGTGTAGTGTAGTGTAGTGTAGTGTAGTGTAGTGGVDGTGGTTAGAAGTVAQGGTAGDASGGTSGTGTDAGGYNTDAACMGIKSNMPCTPEGQDCPNLRCGLADLGRRACVCATNWTCESCAFPADAPQEVVGAPATALPACDATVVKGEACTTQGDRCQPAEAGDVCACWTIGGTLEWDCDSKPWE